MQTGMMVLATVGKSQSLALFVKVSLLEGRIISDSDTALRLVLGETGPNEESLQSMERAHAMSLDADAPLAMIQISHTVASITGGANK